MIVAKTLTGDPCVRKGGGGRCTRHRCSRSCCKCARASDGLRGSQTRGVAVFRASPLDLSGLRVVNLCAGFWDAMPLAQCGGGGGEAAPGERRDSWDESDLSCVGRGNLCFWMWCAGNGSATAQRESVEGRDVTHRPVPATLELSCERIKRRTLVPLLPRLGHGVKSRESEAISEA